MLAVKAKPLRGRFARLDRSARLRLWAITALLRKADFQVGFCQQKPWRAKAASARRCHPQGRSEAEERRRCAWHGRWIGGESPLRGLLEATASRRQLHCREAVWEGSPRRTAAPNSHKPLSKPDRPGQRVQENASILPRTRRPKSNRGRGGSGGGGGGTSSESYPGRSAWVRTRAVDSKEATTTGRRPRRSRISS